MHPAGHPNRNEWNAVGDVNSSDTDALAPGLWVVAAIAGSASSALSSWAGVIVTPRRHGCPDGVRLVSRCSAHASTRLAPLIRSTEGCKLPGQRSG